MRRLIRPLLLGALVTAGVWSVGPGSRTAAQPAEPAGADGAGANPKWMGVASCTAASCHNANGREGSLRSEYSTWASYDKHAHAYEVLTNDRSARIVRNLYGDKARPAPETEVCLKCHASNDGQKTNAGDRFFVNDGVGCESCHGASERWLPVHYQDGFRGSSPEKKAEYGLRDTKDLVTRVSVCVACHVGTADKDVNHDLIAAGHPRLSFEFGAYHSIYHKHWDPAKDRARQSDFEARAWAVGQIVTARASLELLAARAEGASKSGKDNKPWPEFAEYACFACHKDLQVSSSRQQAAFGGGKPGALPWGTWYLPMAESFSRQSAFPLEGLDASVAKLRTLMQQPGTEPGKVAAQAKELAGSLGKWERNVASSAPWTSQQVRQLLAKLAGAREKDVGSLSWDEATQLYLALAALNQSLGELKDPARPEPGPLAANLRALREPLRGAFVPGFDSPKQFQPAGLEKPLADIRKLLGN